MILTRVDTGAEVGRPPHPGVAAGAGELGAVCPGAARGATQRNQAGGGHLGHTIIIIIIIIIIGDICEGILHRADIILKDVIAALLLTQMCLRCLLDVHTGTQTGQSPHPGVAAGAGHLGAVRPRAAGGTTFGN